MDIVPMAFSSSGKLFSAQIQVSFRIIWRCPPLTEGEFFDAIKENYHAPKKFHLHLSGKQVSALILENTFTSILDMVGVVLPILKWFIGSSASKAPKVLNFLVQSPWSTIDIIGQAMFLHRVAWEETSTRMNTRTRIHDIHFIIIIVVNIFIIVVGILLL